MRPLRLTMTAFGPYRASETIDFELMNEHRLFVISGNTGAGKTTIFDAICFALYGAASGEDRADFRMLRSQFADENVHTAIELDFAIGAKSYRVFRQMKHRKGANKSETGDKNELYELLDGHAVPAVDRFMATEVNAKLQQIIGLTREQFIQIVMLPQGEFRKLLTSDTDNKEEILRKIFQTELYERLEGKFQQQHRQLLEELREYRASMNALMKQAQEAMPCREESEFAKLVQQEQISPAQFAAALQQEAAHYYHSATLAAQQKQEQAGKLEQKRGQRSMAEQFNKKHDDYLAKTELQEQLLAKQPQYQELEEKLEQARKASAIAPYAEQRLRAKQAAALSNERLLERQASLAAAGKEAAAAESIYEKELQQEANRKEAERELQRLEELAPAVKALTAQEAGIRQLLREEQALDSQLLKQASEHAELLQQREKLRSALQAGEHAAEQAPAAKQRLDEVTRLGRQISKLLEHLQEISAVNSQAQALSAGLEQARMSCAQLEQRWIEGQAGLLAAHLHDGSPCPVCGSRTHPAKTEARQDMPSREQLQSAKEQLSALERQVEAARVKAEAALATSQAYEQELIESELEADAAAGVAAAAELKLDTALLHSPDLLRQTQQQFVERQLVLRQQWKVCKEEHDRLTALAGQWKQQRRLAQQLEQQLQQLDASKQLQHEQLKEMSVKRAANEALLNKELERIPAHLREYGKLERRLTEQSRLVESQQQRWKQAQEAKQAAATKLAAATAFEEQAEREHKDAQQQAAEATDRMLQELLQAGFQNEENYLNALMSVDAMQAAQSDLEQYKSSIAVIKEQLTILKAELEGKPRIELAELDEQIRGLHAKYEALIEQEQSAALYAREAERLSNTIADMQQKMKQQEQELEEVADIYAMLKGDNALKISFERYILIEFLEQILILANERLKKLSNGQFELQRSDRLETRGKQSGLGLDVYDAYTGQNRDVKSMSGGEKFNASLCLALGMADVIQANKGGITIEMMLIDEGFGALDEEALHKAIDALVDLQKAGRMIGVISHVQEVKEAFPACIEVYKTREGYSKTKVLLKM